MQAENERVDAAERALPTYNNVSEADYETAYYLLIRSNELKKEITRRTMPTVVAGLPEGVVIETGLEPEQ